MSAFVYSNILSSESNNSGNGNRKLKVGLSLVAVLSGVGLGAWYYLRYKKSNQ